MPACEPCNLRLQLWLQAPLYLLQWISEGLGGAANYKLTDYEIKYSAAGKGDMFQVYAGCNQPFSYLLIVDPRHTNRITESSSLP